GGPARGRGERDRIPGERRGELRQRPDDLHRRRAARLRTPLAHGASPVSERTARSRAMRQAERRLGPRRGPGREDAMAEDGQIEASAFGSGAAVTRAERRVNWPELLRHELEEALRHDPVVIVPTGSVEQHGPHCPMDVDISIPLAVATACARRIEDFPVIVAPPVWAGLAHYNLGHVGTITLSAETYIAYLSDVCRSIHANGFERIVLLNGHGGNRAINQVVAIKLAEEDIFLAAITYWDMVERELLEWSERDEGSIGHGGEWETSLQLHLRPRLVDLARRVSDPPRTPLSPATQHYTWMSERRREMPRGVYGDPFVASADKGARLFEALVGALERTVRELHATPIPHYVEFGSHSRQWVRPAQSAPDGAPTRS